MRSTKRAPTPADGFNISVAKGNGQPLVEQLHDQIIDRIAAGEFVPGMRLPPVRSLARQLAINPMTVSKAYKGLAEAGFLETRAGGGTYVRLLNGLATKDADNEQGNALQQPLLSERLYELSHAPGVVSFTANFPRSMRSVSKN